MKKENNIVEVLSYDGYSFYYFLFNVIIVFSIYRKQWFNLDFLFSLLDSCIKGYHCISRTGSRILITASTAAISNPEDSQFTVTHIYTNGIIENLIVFLICK